MEVIIDLRQDPAPFPEPRIFNWSKDGQLLSDDNNYNISLTYSNVTFLLVTRNISGNYTVIATNFLLGNFSQQLGSDVGSFHLDVLCKYCYIMGLIINDICNDWGGRQVESLNYDFKDIITPKNYLK